MTLLDPLPERGGDPRHCTVRPTGVRQQQGVRRRGARGGQGAGSTNGVRLGAARPGRVHYSAGHRQGTVR